MSAGGGSLSGQGASTGGGAGSDGFGGVSDSASLGNVGGLVFDGAGNIVSGVQSAFGDVPATYTGKQVTPMHMHMKMMETLVLSVLYMAWQVSCCGG